MLEVKMRSRTFITLPALALLLTLAGSVFAMQDPPQDVAPDPIEQLRLTPEQRQRIRVILEQTKNERQVTNRRLREANIALNQALNADPVDESIVEQRVNELAAAQTAQLRMRIQTELKVRRELRPEQLAMLQRLQLQIRDVMGGGQRPANTFNPRPGRNALTPQNRNIRRP